jgi:uncharacterized protein YciI
MLVIDIHYTKPFAEVEKVLQAHRDFLRECYAKGYYLASGPKNPKTGGVIIALVDKEKAQTLIEQDPFKQAGVGEYTITEFEPVLHDQAIASLLNQ